MDFGTPQKRALDTRLSLLGRRGERYEKMGAANADRSPFPQDASL
jgi:hypothetical protein